MIDVDEAQRLVLAASAPLPTIELPLVDALHCTLAKPVMCDVDYPPFDRALMDGYAVHAEDTIGAPIALRVVGQIPAGERTARPLARGEAMQINTGAPLPPGANAVVRVEETQACPGEGAVLVQKPAKTRQFITDRAAYVSAGATVVAPGIRITPLEIAAAAAAGASRLTVFRAPTVAVLVTGNELIDVDAAPREGMIRNSNAPMLEALVRSAHAMPDPLGVARDDPVELRRKIERGLKADVLCITGGVSMGAFDFVPDVLAELGAEVGFQKMVIKPGRPVLFARAKQGTLIFALPGNPVSAFVGFHLLVTVALAAMRGRTTIPQTQWSARLDGALKATENRRSYWPGRARVDDAGAWTIEPLIWRGSGDVFGMVCANGLIMRPPGAPAVERGAAVTILPLDAPIG